MTSCLHADRVVAALEGVGLDQLDAADVGATRSAPAARCCPGCSVRSPGAQRHRRVVVRQAGAAGWRHQAGLRDVEALGATGRTARRCVGRVARIGLLQQLERARASPPRLSSVALTTSVVTATRSPARRAAPAPARHGAAAGRRLPARRRRRALGTPAARPARRPARRRRRPPVAWRRRAEDRRLAGVLVPRVPEQDSDIVKTTHSRVRRISVMGRLWVEEGGVAPGARRSQAANSARRLRAPDRAALRTRGGSAAGGAASDSCRPPRRGARALRARRRSRSARSGRRCRARAQQASR